MTKHSRQSPWAWAIPVIIVAVVAASALIWKWDDLRRQEVGEVPLASGPADVAPAAEPSPADARDEARSAPGEGERLWREVLGREPTWPDDLTDPLQCASVAADLRSLGAAIDERDYLRRRNLEDGTGGLMVVAARQLAARPPVVSGENRELDLVLSNAFHLFRVLGRDRLAVLREIERREQRLAEPAMMAMFRWAISRQKCGEDPDLVLEEKVIYDYAAFLLRSLGGQAYLRRRSPRVEGLATFYAVMALDRIIAGGHDPLYVDLKPDIERARELLAGQELVFRDRYLEQLGVAAARRTPR